MATSTYTPVWQPGTLPATRQQWAEAFLTYAKYPVTAANVRAIVIWETAEGGSAKNNPLNTTQSAPGATNYNSVGVKNYPTVQSGMDALKKTLEGNHSGYAAIRQSLSQGTSTLAVVSAVGHSVWGTTLGTLLNLFHSNTDYGHAPVATSNIQGLNVGAGVGAITGAAGGVVGAVTAPLNAITSIADAVKWVFENPLRIFYVIGGGILTVIGLIQLARRLGSSAVGREVAGAARVAT